MTSRAVDYRRVSAEDQLENFSLDAQASRNAEFIVGRGWHHVGSYVDEAISARTTDRPAFQQMIADARAGRFDIIVVHKLDRFSRSLTDMLLTLRELEQIGVTVVSVTEQFDFTTPIGKVLLALLVAFAQWYLDNLALEVKKGKLARAEAGHWQNRLPFGYTVSDTWRKDGGEGLAIPDDHDRQGYELAIRLAETGEYSYRQIGNALNEAGFRPTGRAGRRSLKLWSTDSVRNMLRNPFYLGIVTYKGRMYPGLHEPLITQERWERVQVTMGSRARVNAFKATTHSRFYLLSGLLRCAHCGSPMRGEYRTNNLADEERAEYRYYRCSARYRNVACPEHPIIRAEALERMVEAWLIQRLPLEDSQRQIQERAERLLAQQTPKATVNESRRLKSELERLKDLYRLGDIERDHYLAERDRLRAQLDTLPTARTARHVQRVTTTLLTLPGVWQIATPAERRKLVREIIRQIIVHDPETIVVTPRPDYAPYLVD